MVWVCCEGDRCVLMLRSGQKRELKMSAEGTHQGAVLVEREGI